MFAMRQRNTGVIRPRDNRTDPGNDFEWNTRLAQLRRFLAAAPEDIWIATLQAHHRFPFPALCDKQRVQFVLSEGVILSAFAAKNYFRLTRRKAQQIRIHERVVDHHIRARQQFRATHGEQPGVSRTGPDEINYAFLFHTLSYLRWTVVPMPPVLPGRARPPSGRESAARRSCVPLAPSDSPHRSIHILRAGILRACW